MAAQSPFLPRNTLADEEGSTMTVIRAIREAECAAFAELATELGYPCDVDDVQRRLSQLHADPDHAVLVAELSRAVVGWVEVRGSHVLFQESSAEIVGLVVDQALRGHGVGARLVSAAEAWASAHGYSRMRVRSNVVRTRTHGFYERLGYARAKTQHVFEREVGAPGAA
jgi:GNAT superfamily N-acetyltransferase